MNLKKIKKKKNKIHALLNSSKKMIYKSKNDNAKLYSDEKFIQPIISTTNGAAYRIEDIN